MARPAARVSLVVDACPDHCVGPPSCDARTDEERDLPLESQDEEAQALDAFVSARQESPAPGAGVPLPARKLAAGEIVLNHDDERARHSLQLHVLVLVPAHRPRRHVTRPRSVHRLAQHALVE